MYLWIVGMGAVLGNVFLAILLHSSFRIHHKSDARGHFVFMKSLGVGNFMCGCYALTIAAADAVYKGAYLTHEESWTSSVPCKVAGMLWVLSFEVSVLSLVLLTLDRVSKLKIAKYPMFHFKFHSSLAASMLAWVVALLLAAAVLLFPSDTLWTVSSMTGMCTSLPASGFAFYQSSYFILLMSTASVYVLVFQPLAFAFFLSTHGRNADNVSVKEPSWSVEVTEVVLAHRVSVLVTTSALCLAPVLVVGLASLSGSAIPDDVARDVLVYSLPLSSALHPLVYAYRMLAEKRQREHRERMTRIFERLGSKLT
jgi:hypothetical protein